MYVDETMCLCVVSNGASVLSWIVLGSPDAPGRMRMHVHENRECSRCSRCSNSRAAAQES